MTNEEAIAVLKEKYCGIGSNDLFVFRKAIEALEKQIPKKPYKYRIEYFCPVCIIVCVGKNHFQGNKTRHDYCMRCGQAIDWSETE